MSSDFFRVNVLERTTSFASSVGRRFIGLSTVLLRLRVLRGLVASLPFSRLLGPFDLRLGFSRSRTSLGAS